MNVCVWEKEHVFQQSKSSRRISHPPSLCSLSCPALFCKDDAFKMNLLNPLMALFSRLLAPPGVGGSGGFTSTLHYFLCTGHFVYFQVTFYVLHFHALWSASLYSVSSVLLMCTRNAQFPHMWHPIRSPVIGAGQFKHLTPHDAAGQCHN